MTYFLATTTATILRGTAVNRFGDEIDTDTVVQTRVPVSILPGAARGARPASGRRDTPRPYVLRISGAVTIQQDDRIRDERTGWMFAVTTLDDLTPNQVGHGVTRADLQRVS